MTIYEIDQSILALVDPETGELLDCAAFERLQLERERKLEGMALWVKDLTATAAAIGEEIKALQGRKQAAERKAEHLKAYLSALLAGEKFQTPRCSVTYRRTTAVEIEDPAGLIHWLEDTGYDDCVKYRPPELSKTAVGKLLKEGVAVPGASLRERLSLGVK